MLSDLKNSAYFISLFVTLNSVIISNSYRESNYEVIKEICEPEYIYCSDKNMCLKVDCIRDYLTFQENNQNCPPLTNYCYETDECLPNCPKLRTTQENKNVLTSNVNMKNNSFNTYYSNKISNETTELRSSREMESHIKNKFGIITITIIIEADFDSFIGDNINLTKVHLTNELSKIFNISKTLITDLKIIRGSVLVKFNVSKSEKIDEQELVNQNYSITDVKGRHYSVRKVLSELNGESSPPDDSNDDDNEPKSETSTKSSNSVTQSMTKLGSSSAQESSSVRSEPKESTTISSQNSKQEITTESMDLKSTPKPPPNTTPENSRTSAIPQVSTSTPVSITTTTTTKSLEKTSTESNLIVSITITIDGDYDTVVGVDKQQFLNNVKRQLARHLRVPLISIVNMDSKPGSIVVIFELIPSDDPNFIVNYEAIKAAKYEFEQKIIQNKVSIVDSAGIPHKVLSIYDNNGENSGHKSKGGFFYEGSYLILGLAIGAIVISVVLIIVTACAVRSYMYRKYQRQIAPRSPIEMITNVPSNEVNNSANTIRMTDGITSEGASSLGHYSFDSGVWAGTAPELPVIDNVPEPPNYLPPNKRQISVTPKPPSNVLNRIRREWKSDENSKQ